MKAPKPKFLTILTITFLTTQAKAYGEAKPGEKAWTDFCHALFNVKEFVFVN